MSQSWSQHHQVDHAGSGRPVGQAGPGPAGGTPQMGGGAGLLPGRRGSEGLKTHYTLPSISAAGLPGAGEPHGGSRLPPMQNALGVGGGGPGSIANGFAVGRLEGAVPVSGTGGPGSPGPQVPAQDGSAYRPLNVKDALSYLEQVKFQFSSRPDVYNHFLDIMKDFKSQAIDTPGVIERVSTLFHGYPALIQGFNTFLPHGYNIECPSDPNDPIKVTTPFGTIGEIPITGAGGNHAHGANTEPRLQSTQNVPTVYRSAEGSPAAIATPATTQEQYGTGPKKAGDVEFSHAISYVNKIKTRFAEQPDIYKHFLEILQTYQREQKPINEVYAQVTVLFQNAPDLLDDFKKFLPDSSAPQLQSHQQINGAMVAPGFGHAQSGLQQALPGTQPLMHQQNLPPLGNFSTPGDHHPMSLPSVQGPNVGLSQGQSGHIVTQGVSNQHIPVSDLRGAPDASFRASEYNQVQDVQYMEPTVRPEIDLDPSLVPVIPEPIKPLEDELNLVEEATFFDKAKKFIGNKQIYTEFLKILNLYSQDLLEKEKLVEDVSHYLSGSPELFDWFKSFVGYQERPKHIENVIHEKHRLDLDLCEACGPSYKRLPKADTFMPCSGRDEMCWEVLNDEWVGHPVWASEDSGFIAHRKNQYEDTLFKIEEERHEYDFYIEANLRTIQTLETIANKIANMTPEEKAAFKLPPGLGHTSVTIYKKVIRKVYDKDRGFEIIDALHEHPAITVPLVLKRLKQKDEEWRRAQREWNKVWRELEQKVFYKSLDHLGLTFKQADKKLLTAKQLISEISSIKVDQSNKRIHPLTPKAKSQLSYDFKEPEVFQDILSLVMVFLANNNTYSPSDNERLKDFFKGFISLFFSYPLHEIEEGLLKRSSQNGTISHGDDTRKSKEDPKTEKHSARKRVRDDTEHLLRDILYRNKQQKVNKGPQNDQSSEEFEKESDIEEKEIVRQEAKKPWLLGSIVDEADNHGHVSDRVTFNMFANTNIYVFFRHLTTMYERLVEVKKINGEVTKEISNRKVVQFAKDLNLISTQLTDMGLDFKGADAYEELLRLSRSLISGELEHQWFEESLRQAYKNKAFKLYTIDKVIQALVKHAHTILMDHKTVEIMLLFDNDRTSTSTSTKDQILYRLQVRSNMSNIENMFRIEYNTTTSHASIQFVAVEDLTLDEPKSLRDKWQYYLTSYSLSHPTEGISHDNLRTPFLEKIIERDEGYIDDGDERYSPEGVASSNMKVKIDPLTYSMEVEPGCHDIFSRKSVNKFPTRVDVKKKKSAELKLVLEGFLNGERGWKRGLTTKRTAEAERRLEYVKNNGTLDDYAEEISTDTKAALSTTTDTAGNVSTASFSSQTAANAAISASSPESALQSNNGNSEVTSPIANDI
ncbi:ACL004Wp [Eremothecium gossypii ATCC 10895]|uniref:ACL004Wp n=1 Tax=Eremothecium gossypii (strain ATCC 10895 / CBS 109.51 / FGSC 9923 / NRRL Y-1056) TaxID=284811 RepID=Q75CF0_EREGS|nr:ACL004Wp [Eremothecium gossypii ATCC 10895]AAS51224.1 ACL004Wp [Eremothecium gossypii ATCC 10895]AEY95515.1 FACL004Wp [Eremothecium gossypii FDAG1]